MMSSRDQGVPLCLKIREQDGTRITCDQSRWEEHIIARHPEMAGRIEWVRETVESPTLICRSIYHARRRLLYRPYQFDSLPTAAYLRVVVEYHRNMLTRLTSGIIISAFAVANVEPDAEKIWPPKTDEL